jgi:heparinase II/III-like protein
VQSVAAGACGSYNINIIRGITLTCTIKPGTMNRKAFIHRLHAMGASEASRRAYRHLAGGWITARIERESNSHADSALLDQLLEKPLQAEPQESVSEPVLAAAVQTAEMALTGRVKIFGREVDLGESPDWLADPAGEGSAAGLTKLPAWSESYTATGLDIRSVWELNRLQVLVELGRAWRLTRREEFASLAVRWITGWNEQNPFGRTVNWSSGLEVSLRAISLLVAVNCLRDSPPLQDKNLRAMLARLFYLHGEYIATHTSPPSSGFNHLAGEAAGLALLGEYLPGMNPSAGWRIEGLALLRQCVHRLILPDGGGLEGSLHYLSFVCRLASVVTLLCGRSVQDLLGREGAERLRAAYGFLAEMTDGGRAVSEYGDSDDAWLPGAGPDGLGEHYGGTLNLLWLLGEHNDLRHDFSLEPDSIWLYGAEQLRRRLEQSERLVTDPLVSFGQSGHHAARPWPGAYLRFECGHWGDGVTWAHAHADRLSFSFFLDGSPVFADPGTGFYLGDTKMRDYFRSSRAHSTATVDGFSQGSPLATFMWEREIVSSLEEAVVTVREIVLAGRLESGHPAAGGERVIHSRRLCLYRDKPRLVVEDLFQAGESHEVEIVFTLHPSCEATMDGSRVHIRTATGMELVLLADQACRVSLHRGEHDPLRGWYSPGFGRVEPCWQIVCSARIEGNSWFNTEIRESVGEGAVKDE